MALFRAQARLQGGLREPAPSYIHMRTCMHMFLCMYIWIDGFLDRWIDGCMDAWMDG